MSSAWLRCLQAVCLACLLLHAWAGSTLKTCPSAASVCSVIITDNNGADVVDTAMCACPPEHVCPSKLGNQTVAVLGEEEIWFGLCRSLSQMPTCKNEEVFSRKSVGEEGYQAVEVYCDCPRMADVIEREVFDEAGSGIQVFEAICTDEAGESRRQKRDVNGDGLHGQGLRAFYKRRHQNLNSFYKRGQQHVSAFYKRGGGDSTSAFYKRGPGENFSSFYKRGMGEDLSSFYKRRHGTGGLLNDNHRQDRLRRNAYSRDNSFYKRDGDGISSFYKRPYDDDLSSFYKRGINDGMSSFYKKDSSNGLSSFYKRGIDSDWSFYKRGSGYDDDLSSFYKRSIDGDWSFYKRGSGYDDDLSSFYKRDTGNGVSSFYKRGLDGNLNSFYKRSFNGAFSSLHNSNTENGLSSFYKRDEYSYNGRPWNGLNSFYKRGKNGDLSSFYKRGREDLSGFYKRGWGDNLSGFYKRNGGESLDGFYKRTMDNLSSFYKRGSPGSLQSFYKRTDGRHDSSFYKREPNYLSAFYKRYAQFGDNLSGFYKRGAGDKHVGNIYKSSFGDGNDLSDDTTVKTSEGRAIEDLLNKDGDLSDMSSLLKAEKQE